MYLKRPAPVKKNSVMKPTTTKPRKTSDNLGNRVGTETWNISIWNMKHKISVQARGPKMYYKYNLKIIT